MCNFRPGPRRTSTRSPNAHVMDSVERLQLLDWQRTVGELYRMIRLSPDPPAAWASWCTARDVLFRDHPQSPFSAPDRSGHRAISYFQYDPRARIVADVEDIEPLLREIPTSEGTAYVFARFAVARFELFGQACELDLYWLEGYGGGLFLPFRDGTTGTETYGGGRYLLDTVKGADLGVEDGRLVLDFNFAYNPSCAYDPRWVCPLAPAGNRLPVPLRAGERAFLSE